MGAKNPSGTNQCRECMSMRAGAVPTTMGRSISQITLPEPNKAKKGKKSKNEMDLKKKFDELDADGNGSLGFREWCFALNDLGIPWQPDKAKRIWKQMDLDNSKGIDFQEFSGHAGDGPGPGSVLHQAGEGRAG